MEPEWEKPRRRMRVHKAALQAIGVGAIALVAIWIAGLFSSGGGGQNSNGAPSQPVNPPNVVSPTTLPATPAERVVVTVREHDYVVDGNSQTLQEIIAAAKAAAAAGISPPAQIIRVPDSREGAIDELEKALSAENIPYSELDTPAG